MVLIYSQPFTTTILTSVFDKRACIFILLCHYFCISVEVFYSNLKYPYIGLIQQGWRTKTVCHCCTVHLELSTGPQPWPLDFQPISSKPEMPVLQLSCTRPPSYPSLSLVLLGAVCHLPSALLWLKTPFGTWPYTAHKTHSPSLNLGYLDWFLKIGISEWEIVQCLEDFNFCAELHIFSLRTAGHAGPCFIHGYLTQNHCANSCSLSMGQKLCLHL